MTRFVAHPTVYKTLPPGRGVKPVDLTGARIGLLVVQGFVGVRVDKAGVRHLQWHCLCDCGGEATASTRDLRRKHKFSCGCIARRGLLPGGNKKDYGEARFNDLYLQYQRNARSRGYCFELSKDVFRALTKGLCAYCGCEPAQVIKAAHGVNGEYTYNGVDRINNTVGYVPSNVQSCCKTCNRAKETMSEPEFLAWIEAVYTRRCV